jgi:hypothetical protein
LYYRLYWQDIPTYDTDDPDIRRICGCGKSIFRNAPLSLNAIHRGMVLYMPSDHCHPAEGSNLHLGMDKTRSGKDGDIRKIMKILFNSSRDSDYEKAVSLSLKF